MACPQRDLGGGKAKLNAWIPEDDVLADFRVSVARYLRGTDWAATLEEPIAVLSFEIHDRFEEEVIMGEGELVVYGAFDDGALRLIRGLSFSGVVAGEQRRLTLPLTLHDPEKHPFDLEPWPAESLREAGFFDFFPTVQGTIVDRTQNEREYTARWSGPDIDSGDLDEYLIFSTGPELEIFASDLEIQKQLESNLDYGALDPWSDVVGGTDWIKFTGPGGERLSLWPCEQGGIRAAASDVALDDPGLVDALFELVQSRRRDGDLCRVRLLSRSNADRTASVATVARENTYIAQLDPPDVEHLFRADAESPWRIADLPFQNMATRAVDVFPLGASNDTVLILTDGEGFFRSTDGGQSWQAASFGEPSFVNAASVRTIVVDDAIYALAVLGTKPGEDQNPLFRLEHRSWVARWRLGLVDILSPS